MDEALESNADAALLNVRMVHGMVGGVATALRDARAEAATYADTARSASDAAERLAAQMQALGGHVATILKAVAQIEEIALQTKVLAINAKVEAVHAGNHGRGFAIVATAIGDLALEASHATQAIARTVREIEKSATSTRAEEKRLAESLVDVREGAARTAGALAEQADVADAVSSYAAEAETALETMCAAAERAD